MATTTPSDRWAQLRLDLQYLGHQVREHRRNQYLSQAEFIDQLGLHLDVPGLSRLETGMFVPDTHDGELLTRELATNPRTSFNVEPVARLSDPDTSHAAAKSVKRHTRTAGHKWWLRWLNEYAMADPDQLTISNHTVGYLCTDEGAYLNCELKISQSGFRTRRAELRDAGFVVDSGHTATVRSGNQAIVWVITEAGRKYLAELE